MQQFPRLFFNIELLSNNKTFKMGAYNPLENIWLFNHFNHLHIYRHLIHYQIDNPKGLEKPVSKLRKKFQKTGELIEYLTSKNYFYQHFVIYDQVFINILNLLYILTLYLYLLKNVYIIKVYK